MKTRKEFNIERVRVMYERGGTAKEFALENFTETELQKPSYPKQTAVEYLVEQLESIGFSINDLADYYNEVQIALEMEKEQIVEAFENYLSYYDERGEVYYNETYGGTKK